ncbi:hypothetical protein KKA14_00800 [bacterium]|nr:hypothetical protein [bacterium]
MKIEFYRALSEAYKANARQVDSEEKKQESLKKAEEYSHLSDALKN